MDNLIGFYIFIFGLCIGSFLNVCIVRMPQEKSVVNPPSHCPRCKKPIFWYDNIPVLSYLLLGGRCRFCKEKISIRYMIVELVTGCLFYWLYLEFGLSAKFFSYAIMTSGLIVAAFVDIGHRIIPDEISIGGMAAGLICSVIFPQLHETHSFLLGFGRSLMGLLIGGGSIYLMGVIGDFIFKKESMGGGDVKLLAMIGAFLGWKSVLLTFFIAPVFGAVLGIIVKIRTKESVIPYGPFLALGAIISLFWSEPIIRWILSGYGLYSYPY